MEAGRDALQLLPILTAVGPNRFPLSVFEAAWRMAQDIIADREDDAEDDSVLSVTPWHVARLSPLLDAGGGSWEGFRLVEAVQAQKAFAFVSMDTHEPPAMRGHLDDGDGA